MTAEFRRKQFKTQAKVTLLECQHRNHRNTEGAANWVQASNFFFDIKDPLPEVWVGPQEKNSKQQITHFLQCGSNLQLTGSLQPRAVIKSA